MAVAHTPEQKAERLRTILALKAEGLQVKEICRRMGLTRKLIWDALNPERAIAIRRAWQRKNKAYVAQQAQAWRINNAERHKANYLRRKPLYARRFRDRRLQQEYGITLCQYEAMFAQQDGRCAICRETTKIALHVDRCHVTKKVRGLLCGGCNRGLGLFRDSQESLRAATEYLERYK